MCTVKIVIKGKTNQPTFTDKTFFLPLKLKGREVELKTLLISLIINGKKKILWEYG